MRIIEIIYFFYCIHIAKSHKVIIVGTGASGIAAATRLIENNVTDFILLEAEKRLGGRIHSIYLLNGKKGGHVDLGGEYVGGDIGNVVYDFAKQELTHEDPSKRTKVFYSNGEKIADEFAEEILMFKDKLRGGFRGEKPISVGEAFLLKYNKTIVEKYKDDSEKFEKSLEFIDTCDNVFLYRYGAFDWNKILLNDHYESCEGDQQISWNGKGYRHFLDLLMRKFGDEHRLRLYPIFYSTRVNKIVWNKNKVVLETNRETYEADHVIFTPSVGVLKENHRTMFEPNLPSDKIEAIENIGFDAAMKVVIQYPKKWWDDNISSFVFVWNKEDREKLKEDNKYGPKKDDKFWLSSFQRLFTVTGMSNILIGWFTGPLVPEIEKLENRDIKQGVHLIVNKFLGSYYNVTEPQLVVPSSWYSNPNFRGVYSYETLSKHSKGRQNQEYLADPLLNSEGVPVVLFAGEHTHKKHFSTVHGAVETGYRAAEELISHLKK